MKSRGAKKLSSPRLVLLIALGATPAKAQQFVVTNLTYTATKDNTTDSHYFAAPLPGTPTDWRSPIDYASGKAYVRLEVISKPSDRKTLYNVCYEGNPTAACMGYSPPYTKPGVVEFSSDLSSIWQYGAVDWSKGVNRMALILKDENGTKVQGDSAFYPTTIHVTITIVAKGATYVPPSTGGNGGAADAGTDAGTISPPARDAGAAGRAGAGGANGSGGVDGVGGAGVVTTPSSGGTSSSLPPSTGSTGAAPPASSSTPAPTATLPAPTPSNPTAPAEPSDFSSASDSGASCSIAVPRPAGSTSRHYGWLGLSAALALLQRRRHRSGEVADVSGETPTRNPERYSRAHRVFISSDAGDCTNCARGPRAGRLRHRSGISPSLARTNRLERFRAAVPG